MCSHLSWETPGSNAFWWFFQWKTKGILTFYKSQTAGGGLWRSSYQNNHTFLIVFLKLRARGSGKKKSLVNLSGNRSSHRTHQGNQFKGSGASGFDQRLREKAPKDDWAALSPSGPTFIALLTCAKWRGSGSLLLRSGTDRFQTT